MGTDNTTLNAGSGGQTYRSLGDASNDNWPVGVAVYATTVSPGANVLQIVTPTNGLPTTNNVQTAGGMSSSSFISTGAVQATNVKGSAGQFYRVSFTNIGSSPVYVRLYDKATTPATTDTPIWRITVPGSTSGAGIVETFPQGLVTTTGLGFRCTAAIADNDATALTANTVLGNIGYF